MLDNLTRRLSGIFSGLRKKGRLNEADVNDMLREVRVALLEADVNFTVAKALIAKIKEEAVGEELFSSLKADEMVVKIVRDNLTAMLGGEPTKFNYGSQPPTVILMCGLQGSGKTTTTAKLAKWLIKQGKKPMLAACDLQRPAAIKQLQVLGEQIDVPVFAGEPNGDPVKTAKEALARCKYLMNDVLIVDTAGRTTVDDDLMDQLKRVSKAVSPNESFLVLDSTTGQEAVNVAQAFHDHVTVTGAIFTKLDGDTRGGAILSVRAATGVPVRFIGVGEQVDALDDFDPSRMAERILGFGDVLGLIRTVEDAQAQMDPSEMESMDSRMKRGDIDFDFLLQSFGMMKKFGSMKKIMGMIPGLSAQISQEELDSIDESKIERTKAMILSMTPKERRNPDLLNGSRRKRIAAGSGTSAEEVNGLIKQLAGMRRNMKQMEQMKKKMGKFGKRR
jgi:signal recognition particle subunit SRP54